MWRSCNFDCFISSLPHHWPTWYNSDHCKIWTSDDPLHPPSHWDLLMCGVPQNKVPPFYSPHFLFLLHPFNNMMFPSHFHLFILYFFSNSPNWPLQALIQFPSIFPVFYFILFEIPHIPFFYQERFFSWSYCHFLPNNIHHMTNYTTKHLKSILPKIR